MNENNNKVRRPRYEDEDALQAPRANQVFHQQGSTQNKDISFLTSTFPAAPWYPGGQILPGAGYARQVPAQVGKYGGQAAQVGKYGGQAAHVGRYGVQAPKYEQPLGGLHQYAQQPQMWNHQQQFGVQQGEEEEEEEEEDEEEEGGDGGIPFYANHRAL